MKLRLLCASFALALGLAAQASAATMVLQIKADEYNGGNSWNNKVSGQPDLLQNDPISRPTVLTNATPSGSNAVYFDGVNDWFHIGEAVGLHAIDADGHKYTVIGLIKPDETGGTPRTITGGGWSSFSLRVGGDSDGDRLRINSLDWAPVGTSNTELSNSNYSYFTASSMPTGSSFRINGAAAGTGGGWGEYYTPIYKIGAKNDGSEAFKGSIVELRIYFGDITEGEIAAAEAAMAAYLVPVPEPSSLAILGLGLGGCALAWARRKRA